MEFRRNVQSLLLSSHDPTGGSYVPWMCKDLEDNLAGVGEIDEKEMHSDDPEKEVMKEYEEMHPATAEIQHEIPFEYTCIKSHTC